MIGVPGIAPKDTQRNRKPTDWLVCHYKDKVVSVEGHYCALTAELPHTSEEKTGSKFGGRLWQCSSRISIHHLSKVAQPASCHMLTRPFSPFASTEN